MRVRVEWWLMAALGLAMGACDGMDLDVGLARDGVTVDLPDSVDQPGEGIFPGVDPPTGDLTSGEALRRPNGGGAHIDGSSSSPRLLVRVVTDATQPRLDNLGRPAPMPPGHAGQTPDVEWIGVHAFEFLPDAATLPGQGTVVYKSALTDSGGEDAIDFAYEPIAEPGGLILSVPLSGVSPGRYPYLRVSLAYQQYQIDVDALGAGVRGRVASFVGVNTFIETLQLGRYDVDVSANRPQGYWVFELEGWGTLDGQAPQGATTVPNPLFETSPIPAGSCLVTGAVEPPLVVTDQAQRDVALTLSFSTDRSFEWVDDGDGVWEPLAGEVVVDMGVRGLVAKVESEP